MALRGTTTLLACLTLRAVCAGHIPEALLGTWNGNLSTSPVGPRSSALITKGYNFLEISTPDAGGALYLRQRDFDQLFKVEPQGRIQYCSMNEEATFEVAPNNAASMDSNFTICWRGPRLPSHAANCTGCACAQWTFLLEGDRLISTMMMSAPAIHMKMELARSGPPPEAAALSNGTMAGYCAITNHTGRASPSPPMTTNVSQLAASTQRSSGCPFFRRRTVETEEQGPTGVQGIFGPIKQCLLLNEAYDVRLEIAVPDVPCQPCNVSFNFSMAAPNGEYVAIGFKERAAAYQMAGAVPMGQKSGSIPDVPSYWGMQTSSDWTTELSGRILAGHGPGCVRQMSAQGAYVGVLEDVKDDGFFSGLSLEHSNGRSQLAFSAELHAGWLKSGVVKFFLLQRVMWATGAVIGDGCDRKKLPTLGYHGYARSLVNLGFGGGQFSAAVPYQCSS